jgi:hypothetical protein
MLAANEPRTCAIPVLTSTGFCVRRLVWLGVGANSATADRRTSAHLAHTALSNNHVPLQAIMSSLATCVLCFCCDSHCTLAPQQVVGLGRCSHSLCSVRVAFPSHLLGTRVSRSITWSPCGAEAPTTSWPHMRGALTIKVWSTLSFN